jgi:hypothetical protein
MKDMEDTIDNNISRVVSLGWDTIATASWGIIGVMGAFVVWLLRIIGGIQFNNWKSGRDKINQDIVSLQSKVGNIEKVIYFYDTKEEKDTNIRRFMVHKFGNQETILSGIDNHVDKLSVKIDELGSEDRELLNDIKKLLKGKE